MMAKARAPSSTPGPDATMAPSRIVTPADTRNSRDIAVVFMPSSFDLDRLLKGWNGWTANDAILSRPEIGSSYRNT
jgi:hypothetical protein